MRRAATLLLTGLVLAAGVAALAGRPVVSYPVSSSMEPTLGPFDLYLVDPWPRSIEAGDIVVFDSALRGGPAVHRVVDGDARVGWTTKGDANADVDQAVGEPYLTRDRVLGKVVTWPSGAPVRLPHAGIAVAEARAALVRAEVAVGGPQAFAVAALLLAAVALAAAALVARPAPPRPAPRSRALDRLLRRALPRGILGRHLGLALLVLLLASAAWSARASRTELPVTLVVVQDPTAADGARAAAPGDAVPRDVRVGSLGLLPTLVLIESGSPGVRADAAPTSVAPWRTVVLTARQVAGDEVGLQGDVVVVQRYPDVLPTEWTLALHRAMPGSPHFALAGLFALAGWAWLRMLGLADVPIGAWLGLREGWL